MTLTLSVLDQSPVAAGADAARAVRDTVRLARAVDPLGYRRYWVAEHHGSASFAGTSPAVQAAVLLQHTAQMRIGTGGVLLPRHDPVQVAETFHLLADLHPGRVDLGLGRAGGPAYTFPGKLELLRDSLARLRGARGGGTGPGVWLLGSGTTAAELAGQHGIGYCAGHFLNPAASGPALAGVRAVSSAAPLILAVRVFVAATSERAQAQAADYLLWRSRKDLGAQEPLPRSGHAAQHRWSAAECERAAQNRRAIVVGDPSEVRTQLTALAARHGVEEIMVNTLLPDLGERVRTYELLAAAFDLRPVDAIAAT
ncbi:luciferase family oxidoreductase group 1 [Krasilnikovia cinnamomea]|uniref:Luciferase family oxidoreductase group 1 n=1 Tax=Krasilnikovia cinnamomea TaxID=349313 RepID=A0A4Q7ZSZ7_9ACTN|nr:LLM class flavin-dependent oxidoreductase [Krasilnikovia cinnamomea]RZU53773.1 luciferase family oxidoreductase group 1 [Krasilnikovia cinnamomea]